MNALYMLVVAYQPDSNCLILTVGGVKKCYRVEMPYLDAVFVGTGDLFASCLLAWMHKDNDLKVRTPLKVITVVHTFSFI